MSLAVCHVRLYIRNEEKDEDEEEEEEETNRITNE